MLHSHWQCEFTSPFFMNITGIEIKSKDNGAITLIASFVKAYMSMRSTQMYFIIVRHTIKILYMYIYNKRLKVHSTSMLRNFECPFKLGSLKGMAITCLRRHLF